MSWYDPQDRDPDLVVAGEWMPLMVLENQDGKLVDLPDARGIEGSHGWWYSLAAGDLDGDGDMDILSPEGDAQNLYWWENPRPSGDPAADEWTRTR